MPFISCVKNSSKEVSASHNANTVSVADSNYQFNNSIISVRDFILQVNNREKSGSPFAKIPSKLLDVQAFGDFKIDTESDTVFLKYEHLYYHQHKPVEEIKYNKDLTVSKKISYESKEFFQLLVWNKDSMVYFDDDNSNLFELSEVTPKWLRKTYDRFFEMVEKWDTVEMKNRLAGVNGWALFNTYDEPSDLIRIVFINGISSIDSFRFVNFRFENDLLKGYFTIRNYESMNLMNYNALIEDIFMYRHSSGLPFNLSDKEKSDWKNHIIKQRKERSKNPDKYRVRSYPEDKVYE